MYILLRKLIFHWIYLNNSLSNYTTKETINSLFADGGTFELCEHADFAQGIGCYFNIYFDTAKYDITINNIYCYISGWQNHSSGWSVSKHELGILVIVPNSWFYSLTDDQHHGVKVNITVKNKRLSLQ